VGIDRPVVDPSQPGHSYSLCRKSLPESSWPALGEKASYSPKIQCHFVTDTWAIKLGEKASYSPKIQGHPLADQGNENFDARGSRSRQPAGAFDLADTHRIVKSRRTSGKHFSLYSSAVPPRSMAKSNSARAGTSMARVVKL
jgi:hypothetical protein